MVYADRAEAGRVLAGALATYAGRPDLLVLALPRGGVPVAYEVARVLQAPLDVLVVRKLGVPGHEEYAMGAIASGGEPRLNAEVVRELRVAPAQIAEVVERERAELQRRQRLYRSGRPAPDVHGRTVIVVDDGLATGATMAAAVEALRTLQPARIVVAVPTGAADTCAQLRQQADEVVCVSTPPHFRAVGQWYRDFAQTSDDQVHDLLARSAGRARPDPPAPRA